MEYCARSRRLEIEASLAHEEKTLKAIKSAMVIADQTTSTMSSILSNFGTRLEKLENAGVVNKMYCFSFVGKSTDVVFSYADFLALNRLEN